MRTVTVRYLVPVYVTVDLDAADPADPDDWYDDDAVQRVFEADESIVRLDHAEGIAAATSGDVIATAYDDDAVDPANLTTEEREKALTIAERTAWPAWTSG